MAIYVDVGCAQFENMNELRKYPFAEDSSLSEPSGREMPSGIIADAHFVVPDLLARSRSTRIQDGESIGLLGTRGSGDEMPSVVLSSLHLSSYMISACFTSRSGSELNALSITVSSSRFRPYSPYRLQKLAGAHDIGGFVSFGNVSFPDWTENYRPENARIHDGCISAISPSGLRCFVDPRSGEIVKGDAKIDFSGYVTAEKSGKSVRLSLDEGADVDLASACARISGSEACGATAIRSINGVLPDEDGNIVLWFH